MKLNPVFCIALVLSGLFGHEATAAIIYPPAPAGGRQFVIKRAAEILRSDPNCLGGLHVEDLTIAEPFRSYGVGVKDLASGQLFSASKPGQWIYLFEHGASVVGSEQLVIDEKKGNALEFAGLYQAADETLAAVRIAEQLPQFKKQDYELRRLDCVSILFSAIWLHGKSDDIIIPIGSTFGRWNALQPYSGKEMLKLLKPAAKEKLKEPPGMID